MAEQPSLFSEDALRRPAGAEAFAALKQRAEACTACALRNTCKGVVFGAGAIERPDLAFVGESPGAGDESASLPFQGPAGELLGRMISALGYDRATVFLTTAVKCRPPGSRKPLPEELRICSSWLIQELRAVQPRVIVTLGNTATAVLLNVKDDSIDKMRGRWGEWEGIPVMPTFHPAYLLRTPDDKTKAWGDLQEVLKKIGKKL